MHKLNSKRVLTAALTAVLTAALLAGCGGGDSSASSAGGGGFAFSDIGQNISTVFEYVSRLIADNGENTDAADINGFTLATDDTASPTPLP